MDKNKDNYETYEEGNTWITPLGEYNIIHYDCPTKKEIRRRVTETLNEIINGNGFEEDCPLCQIMAKKPYDAHYYCTIFCHECTKTKICKNLSPHSREEEKEMKSMVKD